MSTGPSRLTPQPSDIHNTSAEITKAKNLLRWRACTLFPQSLTRLLLRWLVEAGLSRVPWPG